MREEDYLWDKTGADAEIEGLENALMAFRFGEIAPPALPQKVFALEKTKPRRRFFQFGFALAAGAAVLIVLSLAWLRIGENKPRSGGGEEVAVNSVPRDPAASAAPVLTAPGQIEPIKPIESLPPTAMKSGVVKIRQTNAPTAKRHKKAASGAKSPATATPPETLTAEEKRAYDQLMLALSITGSKLRIVQDKINGIDEKTAVVETAR